MFSDDFDGDNRPMIAGFCVLCTQDLFKDREKFGTWPNAEAHTTCVKKVLSSE